MLTPKHFKFIIFLSFAAVSPPSLAVEPPLLTTQTQEQYFQSIAAHCGKAFEGKVSIDNAKGDSFANKKLIMHVRDCTDTQLKIPFHVGDDASRTWVITKTGSGLSLKHDHRHKDGSSDKLTMYGGHTSDAGYAQVQSFPADAPTIEMFTQQGLPQSNRNIWQIYIYPKIFTYRLIREGREFRVDFDLTQPIKLPVAAWGYKEK
jgi:hypothetical protein